jgi:hypothetical protein
MAHAQTQMNRAMEEWERAASPYDLQMSARFSAEQLHRMLLLLCDFLAEVRGVLHDDWEYTEAHIQGNATSDAPSINPNGTFLEPNVTDEANNWGNRGAFLGSYRRLVEHLGFVPTATMRFTIPQEGGNEQTNRLG